MGNSYLWLAVIGVIVIGGYIYFHKELVNFSNNKGGTIFDKAATTAYKLKGIRYTGSGQNVKFYDIATGRQLTFAQVEARVQGRG